MAAALWDLKIEPCRDEQEKRGSRKVARFYTQAAESMIMPFAEMEKTEEQIEGARIQTLWNT